MPDRRFLEQRVGIARPDAIYVGGEWLTPMDGGSIEVISPVDGRCVATVARAGTVDVARAASAARQAFDAGPWPRLAVDQRIVILERMLAALERRAPELAGYWTLQIGALARTAPYMIQGSLAASRRMLDLARDYPFEERVSSTVSPAALVLREPVGTVAAIVPWNSPFTLLMVKIMPALVSGCTIVVKPSPETPLEAYVVAECAEEAGLPPGVFNLLPADREESGLLVADPRIDKVSFTGSTTAGRAIGAVCAGRVSRCTLELGGKSAAVMLDDYDVENAAELLARTIVMNAGQICSMLGRAIIPRAKQEQLAAAVARRLDDMQVGDPADPATDMGPLASRRQLERVLDLIASALIEGARLVTGGGIVPSLERGCFIRPTLFADVTSPMRIAQEEVFGPVLCLIPHDGEEDAIRLANDTVYGLNGVVLTDDIAAAHRVARGVRSGKFAQNGFLFDFDLPSGGVKQSGTGREGGREGLEAYLETKVMLMVSDHVA